VGLLVAVSLAIDLLANSREDRAFRRRFNVIEQGMTRGEVIEMLGEPDDEGATFRLNQQEGFEGEYERAAKSASTYYLFWAKGIDLTYAIGFAEDDRVRMRSVGGT
jgi:hypothetical protein